ncbi:hypothetical protein [Gryllotalpicola protaetiae]|uniref:Uncharacterized protein n=1 Tax=Gryllotalpicola protaetiae TaxID=2419771 RepID=A0A387BN91_9MICO|nr:hypothetical protein [Gryllotalpicola protaetiae]AYG03902.1 hypothetical protein D7I44_10380 [Gryllotalpicola protaetiae]
MYEDNQFELVALERETDPDLDVARDGGRLSVHGRAFIVYANGTLLANLPTVRATDLITRGVATAAAAVEPGPGRWVAISDTEDWSELAEESHQFVGEPPVGRAS